MYHVSVLGISEHKYDKHTLLFISGCMQKVTLTWSYIRWSTLPLYPLELHTSIEAATAFCELSSLTVFSSSSSSCASNWQPQSVLIIVAVGILSLVFHFWILFCGQSLLVYIFDPKSNYPKSMRSRVAACVLSLEVKLQSIGFPSCCHMRTPRVDIYISHESDTYFIYCCITGTIIAAWVYDSPGWLVYWCVAKKKRRKKWDKNRFTWWPGRRSADYKLAWP